MANRALKDDAQSDDAQVTSRLGNIAAALGVPVSSFYKVECSETDGSDHEAELIGLLAKIIDPIDRARFVDMARSAACLLAAQRRASRS